MATAHLKVLQTHQASRSQSSLENTQPALVICKVVSTGTLDTPKPEVNLKPKPPQERDKGKTGKPKFIAAPLLSSLRIQGVYLNEPHLGPRLNPRQKGTQAPARRPT